MPFGMGPWGWYFMWGAPFWGRRRRWIFPWYGPWYLWGMPSKKEEKSFLEEELNVLQEEMEEIKKRLEELEKE